MQLHNLDIGDGCLISVSAAEFSKTESKVEPLSNLIDSEQIFLSTVYNNVGSTYTIIESHSQELPSECESQHWPVVLILNVFSSTDAALVDEKSFFSELEVIYYKAASDIILLYTFFVPGRYARRVLQNGHS